MPSVVSLPATSPLLPSPWHNNPTTHHQTDDALMHLHSKPSTSSAGRAQPPPATPKPAEDSTMKPSRDNCDRRRPGEDAASRLPNISRQSMSQSVTPFLREHIPSLYAPIGKPDLPSMMNLKNKDPNSKFCYRHRPDSKCRRAADESKMALIQRVCVCVIRFDRPLLQFDRLIQYYRTSRHSPQETVKQSQTYGHYFLQPRPNNES